MELAPSPKHLGAQPPGPCVQVQGSSSRAASQHTARGVPKAALAVTLCPVLGEESTLSAQIPPTASRFRNRPLECRPSTSPLAWPPSNLSSCSTGSCGSSTALSSLPFSSASECSAHHLITETCPGQPRPPPPLTWVYLPQSTARHLASAGNPLICEFLVPSYTSRTQITGL